MMPEKPTIDLGRAFGQRYQQGTGATLSEIPAAVWVRGQADRENPDGRAIELFPAWLPGPDDDVSAWFPEFFRFSADPQLSPVPGRISEALPPPAANGEYHFFLRWPDGHEDPLGSQRPAGQRGPTARFFVTLDPKGRRRCTAVTLLTGRRAHLRACKSTAGLCSKCEWSRACRALRIPGTRSPGATDDIR